MSKLPAIQFYTGDWMGSKWVKYDFDHSFPYISRHPGVYVIYGDGKIIYIGQSFDVKSRITNHKIRCGFSNNIFTPWGFYRDIKIKVKYAAKYGDWAMNELRLIKKIKPPFNQTGA
jgi:excinuclease UvrABC nuclease subunit